MHIRTPERPLRRSLPAAAAAATEANRRGAGQTAATRTPAMVAGVLAALAAAVAVGPATPAPASPIPGYRLEAVWPADAHGLPAPNNITTGADNRVWLVDGPAEEAVALTPDGLADERRPVPSDTLDLAAGPDGHLYFGRWTGRPRSGEAMFNTGRYDESGAAVWSRRCECATGSGIAATPGRVWLTDPATKSLRWLGSGDGRVTGEITARPASEGFPADVDASPDGTLFATDLKGGAVYAWPEPYLPGDYSTWTMLESSGPFRVGAGTQADGEILVAVLLSDGLIRVHRPDGTLVARFFVPGEPMDLAVGLEGRIYVLDEITREVRVYAPGEPPTPTPVPPDPPRTAGSCRLIGENTVSPASIDRCGTAEVTLHIRAECPPDAVSGAEVALVIDRSLSMIAEGKMDSAKAAARRFLDGLDMRYHRATLVTFSTDARVDHALTADKAALLATLDGLAAEGSGTDIHAAIQTAMLHIGAEARRDALPVVVVLTDGKPNLPVVPESDTAALAAAERARARRAYVITIGLGRFVDSILLETIASSRADFYYAPSVVDLDKIYDTILRIVRSIGLTDLVIETAPERPRVDYVPASGSPPPLVVGDRLEWTRPVLPTEGLTFTWTLHALQAGRWPIGRSRVLYLDADGTRRTYVLPTVSIDVAHSAPTPPGAATPTAGGPPTPTPAPAIPSPPPAAECPTASAWRIGLSVFPDTTGFGGYACPGCNGRFDGGDHWARGSEGAVSTVVIRDGAGAVLWVGDITAAADGPGRALATLCSPPPYRIELVRAPEGYVNCPNSPNTRVVSAARIGADRWHAVDFALWSACAVPEPTEHVPPPACPALPLPLPATAVPDAVSP